MGNNLKTKNSTTNLQLMKVLALLAIVLVATNASTIKEQRLKAMSQLSYTSLFTEIQSQITMGGPLTAILDTIERFDKQIRPEQAEHDAMWAIQQADCAEEIAFRTKEIQDGTDAYNRAEVHHRTCSASLARAEVDLGVNQKDQVDTQSALTQLTAIRDSQHQAFLGEQERHEHAITVLGGAMDFLDELVAGEASLVQLSQHTMNLIQTGTMIPVMHAYSPVITLFAQMAASEEDVFVDQSAVDRVRQMMADMMGTVRVNLDSLQSAEAALQEEFDTVSANLEETLRQLGALEARLSGHIDDMNACVLEEGIVMTAATEKVARNTEMLNTATAMCDAFRVSYETATEGRNEERDLLRIIKQLAEKRMVRYRDASTESKYGENYGAEYENMEYNAGQYDSTSNQWK